jgi:three-Cys-motif partner protein
VKKVKYDVIGYWSEVKLDIIREYASAYSIILSKQKSIRKHIYIDAFAGAGQHISKKTGEFVPGSPLNALLIQPQFSEFHLIDLDGTRAAELRSKSSTIS